MSLRKQAWLYRVIVLFVLGLGCYSEVAFALDSVKPTSARFQASYESLKLPGNERMGLLGGTILYDMNQWLSLGGAAYGAMAGSRGGFITLGFAGALHKNLGKYAELEAGGFVGAGGGRGGYQLQGGGLMLRTHLGALLKFDSYGRVGGGVSWVDFPNGNINSVQPYISYVFPFSSLILNGWADIPDEELGPWLGLRTAEQEFSLVYRRYRIPSGVLGDNGQPQHSSIGLVGVEWNRYLDKHFFLKIESEGAMQGQSHGYMQILLGAGYRQTLTDDTWLKLSASVGPAGGGNVATGGGVLFDVQLSMQQKLGDHLFIESGLGYVRALGAGFRATSVSAMLGYHFFNPDVGREQVNVADLAGFDAKHFRIRMVDQRYLKDAPNWRNHHANLDVDLLGFQLDYFINEKFFLSGQGIGAYKGKGGGYMTGLVGAGLHLPVFETPLFVEGDALIGAAGGGGLDVAGGLVWQADLAIGWRFSDALSVQSGYGFMRAPKGNFKARVLSLSLGYYFSLPVR